MNAPTQPICFTCPLPTMDIAMLVARVVPGTRERTLLAVVRPKTGPWLLSPAGTTHLVEHGGGKFTFVDQSGDAYGVARDLRVRQVLKGLGATIAPPAPPEPPAPPVLPGPQAGTVPVSGIGDPSEDSTVCFLTPEGVTGFEDDEDEEDEEDESLVRLLSWRMFSAVPVRGMAEAVEIASPPAVAPAVEPGAAPVTPAPARSSFPAQRVNRRFGR